MLLHDTCRVLRIAHQQLRCDSLGLLFYLWLAGYGDQGSLWTEQLLNASTQQGPLTVRQSKLTSQVQQGTLAYFLARASGLHEPI